MALTWTDSQLTRWITDAVESLQLKFQLEWQRFSLDIVSGTAVYDLDDTVYDITAVMWKGDPIVPLIGKEPHARDYLHRSKESTPTEYMINHDGISNIRFSPVPNETIGAITTGLFGSNSLNAVVYDAFIVTDRAASEITIPDYYVRYVVKAFVLWKAFEVEGIGQNLQAAQYWQSRYAMLQSEVVNVHNGHLYKGKEFLDHANLSARARLKKTRTTPVARPVFNLLEHLKDSLNNWNDEIGVTLS